MAKKKKAAGIKSSDPNGFDALIKDFTAEWGDIGGLGYTYADPERIPTGIFELDLALGGGIPMGNCIEIYGMESSCKTSVALKIIANFQKLHPTKKCAFISVENTFDSGWARKLGVDMDKLYVIIPDYGEAAVDMVEDLLMSPECGIVAIDSLAGLLTTRELEKTASTRDVGGPAYLVTQLMRKVIGAQSRQKKRGNFPTFIGLNQLRSKIGSYGPNPEDTTGGRALKFFMSLRLRLYAKDEKDPKYHKFLAVRKLLNFSIKKHKFPITNTSGNDIKLCVIPYKGLKVGDVDDFKIICEYLMEHGILEKKGAKWLFNGEKEFSNLKDLKKMFDDDLEYATSIKGSIIETEKEKANREAEFAETTGEDAEDDGDEEAPTKSSRKSKTKPDAEESEEA